ISRAAGRWAPRRWSSRTTGQSAVAHCDHPPADSPHCPDNCGVPMPSDPQTYDLRRLAVPAFGPSLLFGLCEGLILPVLALTARALGASLAVAGVIVAL